MSGSWDLLRNGSKYDMLLTVNMNVDFLDTYQNAATGQGQ